MRGHRAKGKIKETMYTDEEDIWSRREEKIKHREKIKGHRFGDRGEISREEKRFVAARVRYVMGRFCKKNKII